MTSTQGKLDVTALGTGCDASSPPPTSGNIMHSAYHGYSDADIIGGDGDDIITVENSQNTIINGGAGNDTITANYVYAGNINGGAGNDTITVGETSSRLLALGWSTILGGEGDDKIIVSLTHNSSIDGGEGNDEIIVVHDENVPIQRTTITGGAGDDKITLSGTYISSVDGGEGDDTITVTNLLGPGDNTISGGNGNDIFILNNPVGQTITLNSQGSISILGMNTFTNFEGIGGGTGNDTLNANDIIHSGGTVSLSGGGGDDIFNIHAVSTSSGTYAITDFDVFNENEKVNVTVAGGVTASWDDTGNRVELGTNLYLQLAGVETLEMYDAKLTAGRLSIAGS